MNISKKIFLLSTITLLVGYDDKDISDILKETGFTRVKPATDKLSPGNFVVRSSKSSDDLIELSGFWCAPGNFKLPDNLIVSKTETYNNITNNNYSFSAPASLMKIINLNLTAKYAVKTTVKFDNIEILEYAQDQLDYIVKNLGPVCTKNVKRNPEKSYQISRSLRINYTYIVEKNPDISVDVEQKIIAELGKVSAGLKTENNKTEIKGNGIFYGVELIPANRKI